MTDLSKRIAALSPEQRAFFEQSLKQRGLRAPTVQIIPKRPDLDEIPLSFGQQRLWFLDQLDPDSPAYNGPSAVRLSGPVDVGALERSLNEVVRRHEALRTTFTQAAEGHPVQVIADRLDIPLPVHDLRTQPAEATTAASEQERMAAREAEALRLAAIEFRQTFDLERGPLVRAQLLRLAETEYILLFTVHHIVSDGWSTELMIAEVTALYAVFAGGQPAEAARLPVPAIQYPDFAVWQRAYLQGAVLESQLAYWRNRLANAPELLELPTDRPRPAVQTYHGAVAAFSLEQSLAHALAALARRENVTLFMVLLAAFDVLMQRWSGQDDLIVGTTVSGRNRSELNNVMGFFANNLALRTSLGGDPTFRELVQRVRATALEAYSHQDVPFELLVEKLNPNRSRSHAPLFQVVFTLQSEQVPAREVAGVTTRPMLIDNGTAKLDLFMFMWEGQDGLTGTLEYSTNLFDKATIERLIGEFKVLLGGIVAEPDRRISALPLLTEAERQWLRDWNTTEQIYSEASPVHELIAAQAARTPEAIAVVYRPPTADRRQDDKMTRWPDDKMTSHATRNTQHATRNTQHAIRNTLTYGELNARANQLAHALRARGVGPEMLVGVCLERSLDLPVALIGILKAGAAYLPLDPSYPAERLAFMLADAQPVGILTHQHLVEGLPPHAGWQLCLDAATDDLAGRPITALPNLTSLEHLAYVIYTSGSTGAPKGVLGLHRGLVNRLRWMSEHFPFAAAEVACHKTALNFVDSVAELFSPLVQGIPLVLIPEAQVHDPELLVESLAAHQVTRLVLVPSLLRVLLDQCPDLPQRLPHLRLWVTSGEALPLDLAQQFQSVMGERVLLNLYGSSEVAADVTWHELPRAGVDGRSVPIGRPIANTQIYLLDVQLQPVPIGVAGQVYVGGAGLARGYLNRPDLTAERFVPNPFLKDEGLRMKDEDGNFILHPSSFILYKTGDLARYRSDGAIEFLGRSDNQVKIRGFRIEPGEVEAALIQHPDLSQVAVIAQDQHLVAYIVPNREPRTENREPRTENRELRREDSQFSIQELRSFLQTRLPDYMIPAAFVTLDTLPLTPNGKLDRRALPDAGGARPTLEHGYVAPRTPTEAVLALIWAEVLGVDRVGVFDNFFDLGGHSLRAIVLLGRVRAAFQVSLPLQSMFQSTTVAALAALLIEHETQPGRIDKIARLLQRIKGASDEELRTSLEQRRQQNRAAASEKGGV